MAVRKILLVIDMQNDFIDGSLGTPEAQAIVAPVLKVIGKYRPSDIFVTRDTHPKNYLQTAEGKKLPVAHCIRGTQGWQLNEKIGEALAGASVIDKPTFGSVRLAKMIKKISGQEELDITIVGLCTDICVVSNALMLKAFLPEVPIHVLASCCAGVTPDSHREALDTMRSCQIDIRK